MKISRFLDTLMRIAFIISRDIFIEAFIETVTEFFVVRKCHEILHRYQYRTVLALADFALAFGEDVCLSALSTLVIVTELEYFVCA